MLRFYLTILCALAIGIGLGGASAWYSLRQTHSFGGINIGAWTAWPFVSGGNADPYTIAKVVRDGNIPLGAAEGLAFEAHADDNGDALLFNCDYILSGQTPPARVWTLAAYHENGSLVKTSNSGKSAVYSGNIIRFGESGFRVNISTTPVAGNWLSVNESGNTNKTFYLMLRLYDTPSTSTTGLVSRRMPTILRGECLQ
ncbi:MAG: DUF1214 domain-containing protein [Nitratireductor sp.]